MLLEKIERFIKEEDLISKGDRILIGVSGGPDSVVLLHILLSLQPALQIKLAVAHINHSLRGSQSDADEIFVRNLIRKWNLSLYSVKKNVSRFAKDNRLSLEEAGREVRFMIFEDIRSKNGYHKIALGHHADDQAETVLMNFIRGTGLTGLSGIQPRRDRVIRPLLPVSRKEILKYADRFNIPYIEDKSNMDLRFLRNRIRWNTLKEIEKDFGLRPAAGICRTASIARETKDYLLESAKKALSAIVIERNQDEIILDINKFLDYFKAVQKMMLLQIFSEFIPHRRLQYQEINRVLELIKNSGSGKRWIMGDDLSVIRSRHSVAFQKRECRFDSIKIQPGQSINIEPLKINFISRICKPNRTQYTKNKNRELVSFDEITEPLIIRTMHPGDWFYPLGMNRKKKKLHDYFIDEKVPQYQRNKIPLLVSNGRIVWIIGYRIDDRFKITKKTEKILELRISQMIRNQYSPNFKRYEAYG